MRDPILNIHRSHLREILENMNVSVDFDTLFLQAKKKSIKYNIDEKSFIKYSKISEAEYTNKFNLILLTLLQRTNPNASAIKPQDSAFLLLKEISILAQDFSISNHLSIDEGFKIYIESGLKIMGKKYGLNKFKTYNQKINYEYQTEQVIKNNELKKETDEIAKLYKELGKTRISSTDTIHFIYAAQEIVENEAKVEDWIKAQFTRLEWTGKIPEPNQLYGENAKIGWQKYKPKQAIIKTGKNWFKDK